MALDFLKNVASNLLDNLEDFTDLTQVAVVDDTACLSVLQRRYEHGSIYTHCGPLLAPVACKRTIVNDDRLGERRSCARRLA